MNKLLYKIPEIPVFQLDSLKGIRRILFYVYLISFKRVFWTKDFISRNRYEFSFSYGGAVWKLVQICKKHVPLFFLQFSDEVR